MDYSLEPGRHRESHHVFGSVYSVVFLTITLFTSSKTDWQSPAAQSTLTRVKAAPCQVETTPPLPRIPVSPAWKVLPALDLPLAAGACGADRVSRIHGLAHTVCRWPSVGGGAVQRKCCSAVNFALFVYQHESGKR